MTFGTDWGWGADEETCRTIFNQFAERGGNFVDTANTYTNGNSETFVGRFVKGRRDRFVLGTKYTLSTSADDPNAGGNHRKSMIQALEGSLRRLQTDRLDLYWVHVWDGCTPTEEVMRGLDDLVRAGKVLYVGVSDHPAWKVAEANTLAHCMGWTPFVALQVEYSLVQRDAERELLPMAKDLGIGVMPWAPLGGGILSGKYARPEVPEVPAGRIHHVEPSRLDDRRLRIAEQVRRVASQIGRTPAQVALNWLLQRTDIGSPIVGARTAEQLRDNLGCFEFTLSPDQVSALDYASAIDLGFPHTFIGSEQVQRQIHGPRRS
jgi:aryl-alcohol dehydrogenase-like predicted oxidoreductase